MLLILSLYLILCKCIVQCKEIQIYFITYIVGYINENGKLNMERAEKYFSAVAKVS